MSLTTPTIGSSTGHFRHTLKKACVLTVLALSGTSLFATASAQQQAVTPERLSRIERAISDLQGVVYSAEDNRFDPSSVTGQSGLPQGPDSSAASMTVRVSQIERELQTLTGDVERLRYEIDQNNRRIESLTQALAVVGQQQAQPGPQGGYGEGPYDDGSGLLYEDNSSAQYSGGATGGPSDLRGRAPVRPADGGAGGTMNNGQNSGQSPGENAGAGTGLPPGVDSPFPVIDDAEDRLMDPDAAYEGAFDALLSGNYQEAEEGFSQFLADYPDDPRAADAQYRLGEIYLATGANSRAAVAFLDHIKTWPDDARAPESYLKLGIAYNRLGKNAEACQIYTVMGSKYPNMTPALRDRMAIERGKAGC